MVPQLTMTGSLPPTEHASDLAGMELFSVLTCPECGRAERLAMPTDACVFFHECAQCHVRLRPSPGDCCVFCSYGSVPCPPVQAGSGGCSRPPLSGINDAHPPGQDGSCPS